MTTLTILRGISGSGKSTWAEAQFGSPAIVSRDKLRVALFGTEDFIDEDLITRVQDTAIKAALKSGRDVIVDDTNITWKYVKRIAEIGNSVGADVEVKLFNISLAEALMRNKRRGEAGGRFVPPEVIKRQHQRLQGTKDYVLEDVHLPKPYHGTPGKPAAVLVDLDGTLAIMKERSPFDWNRVWEDDVNESVAKAVQAFHHDGLTIVIVSGRDSICLEQTEEWLHKNRIGYDHLYMRPQGDNRKDSVVKAEIFDNHIRNNFNVKFCLDDRDQVVELYRNMGLSVFQVNYGDF